jgi:class 3 adenylate cyclase
VLDAFDDGAQLITRWQLRRRRLLVQPPRVATLFELGDSVISDRKSLLLGQSFFQAANDLPGTPECERLVIHRSDDVAVNVEGGRELAALIPGARYVELPGADHIPFIGDNSGEIVDAIEEFLTGSRTPVTLDRVLATVLFTDIVGSTEKAAALGDRLWRDLLDEHDKVIRTELARFRGREVKSLGDGFLATFDGPARAIRCATSIITALRPLGIHIRAGIHTGEVEIAGDDIRGIAVHITSRVASLGGRDDVVVSRTIKDIVAGSGITFEDFGIHVLKGVPDDWQLYRVADLARADAAFSAPPPRTQSD